jgi:hypothetical protein
MQNAAMSFLTGVPRKRGLRIGRCDARGSDEDQNNAERSHADILHGCEAQGN